MCGIAGFISSNIIDFKIVLDDMIKKIEHRGPNSIGIWYNEINNVGLAHARLSILDLSSAGSQPMHSNSRRYTIVFNGEIYNHLIIRKELESIEKINWNGTSDTETILLAFEKWGIEQSIEKCIGMFAIALWDSEKQNLTLIRDRMGEKPLYYGWVNGNFVFSSEIKPFQKFPSFNNLINRNALVLYLKHSSIPEPYSIYENIYKLESGTLLTVNSKTQKVRKIKYWSTEKLANLNNISSYKGSASESVNELEKLLLDSVEMQMQADVPLGAFLSGGVDSSTIVALMQSQSNQKINTFSIGFDQKEYNEAHYAKKVAKHLGTNHHESILTGKDALDIVPLIPKIYTEPFSESSQIPTYLVAKIAKQKVTVSLSGDAGDELFCGYSRYQLSNNSWSKISKIPYFIRNLSTKALNHIPQSFLETILLPFNGKINVTDKFLKALPLFAFNDRHLFYGKGFMTHNIDAVKWVINSQETETLFDKNPFRLDSYYEEMMATDLLTYLPNNNLVKVDRAGMANSLETRIPLLDHRIVDFALSLPLEYKLRDGVDKWILRQVLYKYVPKSLIERPKMGFGVPLADWLRGPLKEWGENLIDEKRLKEEGFFDHSIVRKKWNEHQSKVRNWQNHLWDVLVFQAWLDEQKG